MEEKEGGGGGGTGGGGTGGGSGGVVKSRVKASARWGKMYDRAGTRRRESMASVLKYGQVR